MRTGKIAGWIAGIVLVLLSGCQQQVSYRVAQLWLHRYGWDSLHVAVQFVKQRWPRSSEPVQPDSVQVLLLSARYDTLHLGQAWTIPVPDARLEDQERLLLEVCGWFEGRVVCDQIGLNASPKRLIVEPEIIYPFRGTTARLYYRLRSRWERQRYDGDGWEPLPRLQSFQGYLLIGTQADPHSRLRVPLRSWEGVIELSALPAFSDFRYALQQRFHVGRSATVTFELYAGRETPELLASVTRRLRPKTEAERKAEVAHFAGEAMQQVVERLSGRWYPVWLQVESWSFNPLNLQYVVEVTARWREGGWFRPLCVLSGVLTISEDGTAATFRWVSGNRRAQERWQQQVGQDVLNLEALPPPELPESDEVIVSGW